MYVYCTRYIGTPCVGRQWHVSKLFLAKHNIPFMNLANKSWNLPHTMNVSDDRLHATTSVYSTWILLANTIRVSGIIVFRTDSFTPGGHSLHSDFTVNCLWIHFVPWGLSSSVLTYMWANLEIE